MVAVRASAEAARGCNNAGQSKRWGDWGPGQPAGACASVVIPALLSASRGSIKGQLIVRHQSTGEKTRRLSPAGRHTSYGAAGPAHKPASGPSHPFGAAQQPQIYLKLPPDARRSGRPGTCHHVKRYLRPRQRSLRGSARWPPIGPAVGGLPGRHRRLRTRRGA